jgi:D-alanyl-D-alanine carboxypeptidase (penicillin-binding protein 5/6)
MIKAKQKKRPMPTNLAKLKQIWPKKINQQYPVFRKKVNSFFRFIKSRLDIQVNLGLLLFIFLLFPTQNRFWHKQIPPKEPIVRKLNNPEKKTVSLKSHQKPFPSVTAEGIYLFELNQKALLYARNPDNHFYPASTTKIVSAMVALDKFQEKQVITVPYFATEGQVLGIQTGEQYYFNDLLYGLLIQSGNDAAIALAKNYPGGMSAFVAKMNHIVANLSLQDTHFANPTGLDAWNHYTSPHDLAVIANNALGNSELASAVATKQYDLKELGSQHTIQANNINELLGKVEGMIGVKTGWTELAGECLVSLVDRNGLQTLIVVLNSADRFGETEKIISWAYDNFYLTDL